MKQLYDTVSFLFRIIQQLLDGILEDVGVLYKASEAVRLILLLYISLLNINTDCFN